MPRLLLAPLRSGCLLQFQNQSCPLCTAVRRSPWTPINRSLAHLRAHTCLTCVFPGASAQLVDDAVRPDGIGTNSVRGVRMGQTTPKEATRGHRPRSRPHPSSKTGLSRNHGGKIGDVHLFYELGKSAYKSLDTNNCSL